MGPARVPSFPPGPFALRAPTRAPNETGTATLLEARPYRGPRGAERDGVSTCLVLTNHRPWRLHFSVPRARPSFPRRRLFGGLVSYHLTNRTVSGGGPVQPFTRARAWPTSARASGWANSLSGLPSSSTDRRSDSSARQVHASLGSVIGTRVRPRRGGAGAVGEVLTDIQAARDRHCRERAGGARARSNAFPPQRAYRAAGPYPEADNQNARRRRRCGRRAPRAKRIFSCLRFVAHPAKGPFRPCKNAPTAPWRADPHLLNPDAAERAVPSRPVNRYRDRGPACLAWGVRRTAGPRVTYAAV
jgi:hypothetical protein